MRIHIIGAGPTGISLAWALSHSQLYEPILYDKHALIGGSWREPSATQRNLHSHRLVFKGAYVNFEDLLSQMGLNFDKYFKPTAKSASFRFLAKRLKVYDFLAIGLLYARTMITSSSATVDESLQSLRVSPECLQVHNTLCYAIDGVPSATMTINEYARSIDKTLLYTPHDQRVSGHVMCKDMEAALRARGVQEHYNTELIKANLDAQLFTLTSPQGTFELSARDDVVILALDAKPLQGLIGGQVCIPEDGMYGSLSLVFSFDEIVNFSEDDFYHIAHDTPWHLLCSKLAGNTELNVVICDAVTPSPISRKTSVQSGEIPLVQEVWRQLTTMKKLPKYNKSAVCWGASWNTTKQLWEHSQSANVITKSGTVDFAVAPNVFACGMLSARSTPFASIEAAVEVSRLLIRDHFQDASHCAKLKHHVHVSHLIVALVCTLVAVYFYKRRKK